MKKLILILSIIFLFILSCKTFDYSTVDAKVIKWQCFDNYRYDWYSETERQENRVMYTQTTIEGIETNYIYGEIELMTYKQYQEDISKKRR